VVVILAILLSPPDLGRLFGSFGGFMQFLISIAFLLVMFYVSFYWLVPAMLARKQTGLFVLMTFIMINVVTFVGYMALQLSHNAFDEPAEALKYSLGMHFSGFHAILTAALFGSLFRVVNGWFDLLPASKSH
jgi:fatty-acid desaturase